MSTNKAKKAHAIATIEDIRQTMNTLMEVNRQLQEAVTLCRALNHDARNLKDPACKAAARRLLRTLQKMKDGQEDAFWVDYKIIEQAAQNANHAADAAIAAEAQANKTGA